MKIEFRKVATLAKFEELPEDTTFSVYDDIEYKKMRVQTIEGDEAGYVGYNPCCQRMLVSISGWYQVYAVLPVSIKEIKVGEYFSLRDDETTVFVKDNYKYTRLTGKGKPPIENELVYKLEIIE